MLLYFYLKLLTKQKDKYIIKITLNKRDDERLVTIIQQLQIKNPLAERFY